jgi:ABC-type antimicrobial peptide transport system permease subunit
VALALAIIGVSGVVAEPVAQRVPEIGVRNALGATGSHVMRLIIGQRMWIVLLGVALGTAGD